MRLEGHFQLGDKQEKVVVKVIPRKRKEIERDDVPYQRLSEHVGRYPVVIVAPDDTALVKDGSEARRKLLDNSLCQVDPIYLKQLILYNQVLKQRNALLKQLVQEPKADASLLTYYNEQLLQPGNYIFQKRKAFVAEFDLLLQEAYAAISGGQEEVACAYQSQLDSADFSNLLLQREERDRILQRSTIGIHRDDLAFSIRDQKLRRFASQGQLKSFVLSIKLAQYRLLQAQKKQSPILLLDDIFDKLDSKRVEFLLGYLLQEEYGQIFLSDTDHDRVQHLASQLTDDFRLFDIDNGQSEWINKS